MAAFNGERYIAESIASVINQTYHNWELIVVDDGSTDRTREIVLGFQQSDARIKYIYQPNSGQGSARNNGIERSQGELIAFLDQDDLWLPDKLKLQIELMRATGVDVVFSNGFMFPGDDVLNETDCFLIEGGRFEGREMYDRLFIRNRIPVLTALVRKEVIARVRGFDDDLAIKNLDDYDLWLRLAERGASFFAMTEKLARYRLHPNQASKNVLLSLKSELAMLEKHRDKVGLSESEKRERFQELYHKLVKSAIREKQFSEAREYLSLQRATDKFNATTLFHYLVLRTLPNHYLTINDTIYRVKHAILSPARRSGE